MAMTLGTGCIGVTEEHLALRDSVRELARRHITPEIVRTAVDAENDGMPPFWGELAEQGLLALHIAEEDGGVGYGLLETAVVAEELGRVMAPGPFLTTVAASAILSMAGHREYLPGLAGGELVGGIGIVPASLRGATTPDGGLQIEGTSPPVMSASLADIVVIPVSVEGEIRWVVVERSQVTVEDPGESLDLTRRLGRLIVDTTVPATAVLSIETQVPPEVMAVLFAAEASGIADWTTHTAAEYANVREQFGRPIGQFQAVKHRCAWMLAASEQARVCAWDGARAFDEKKAGTLSSEATSVAASVAAAIAPQAAFDNAKSCVQVLGGIGFTWEHDTSLYLRRAHTMRLFMGAADVWHRRFADLTLLGVRRELTMPTPAADDQRRVAIREELATAGTLSGAEQKRYLADHGYVAPHYPEPWGKGADATTQLVIAEEIRDADLKVHDLVIGNWVLPTLLAHGSVAQQERFVPPSLRDEMVWCQLFSEPEAGSDLASLSTRADKVDGGWLINGQKVWTSGAHKANFGILLARTDHEVAKHKGLSYFLVDMTSEGIDIRPLRELTGEHMFNEVFLDNVFIPDDLLVGEPGDGWRLARTTLANERVSMSRQTGLGDTGEHLVRLTGPDPDQYRRTVLGRLLVDAQSGGLFDLRNVMRAVSGLSPGAEASVAKVIGTAHIQEVVEVLTEWAGIEAAYGEVEPREFAWWFLNTRSLTIAGGSTEIQLNIIAERILGLPRDP